MTFVASRLDIYYVIRGEHGRSVCGGLYRLVVHVWIWAIYGVVIY